MFGSGSRLRFLAVLAAGAALLCLHGAARAGVVRSPHDFAATGPFDTAGTRVNLAPSGVCSACHIPHSAKDSPLWPRSLAGYRSVLTAADGTPTSEPNFLLSPSLSCYDCHDFHTSIQFESPNVPDINDFGSGHKPQNILFGFTKNIPPQYGDMTEYNWGPQTGKGKPGYYETDPASTSNYGVNTNPSRPLSQTGGHYFKYGDPDGGSTAFKIGDKLPCRDCHDPHAWKTDWQAFIRNRLGGSQGWSRIPGGQPTASTFMANDVPVGAAARNDRDSRYLCIACHGDSGNYDSVRFSDISPDYSSSTNIVRTPFADNTGNAILEHGTTSSTGPTSVACVSCHNHNSIQASCNGCHSYPGLAGSITDPLLHRVGPTHDKHVGRPSDETQVPNRAYRCSHCHNGSDHNTAKLSTPSQWGSTVNVDNHVQVRFDTTWNPATTNPADTTLDSTSYNDSTNVCSNLYCHGDAGVFAARGKTGTNTKPGWDNSASGACGTCHGTGAQMSSANHPAHLDATKLYGPGIDNDTCGTGGACHTAYGLFSTTNHADNTITFRNSADNTLASTTICDSCHSTVVIAALDNGDSNTLSGVSLAKSNWTDNNYRLPCLTCHNNTTQANSKIDNTGVAAPNIEAYWLVTGHGAASAIDNASTTTVNTGVDPPIYQNVPVPCGMCHDINSRHYGTTLATGNAWRLRSTSGYNDANGGLDKFCNTRCHGNAPGSYVLNKPDLPQDHTWILAASPPETKESGQDTHPTGADVATGMTSAPLASDKMPMDNDIRQGGAQNFLCVTCHDPHGIGASSAAPRSFSGTNPVVSADNVHMLRYIHDTGSVLCKKCHI